MTEQSIEFTQAELATIEFRRGDTAVLMCPRKLSLEAIRRFEAAWRRHQPDVRCIVLDEGIRLGVIRATEADPKPDAAAQQNGNGNEKGADRSAPEAG